MPQVGNVLDLVAAVGGWFFREFLRGVPAFTARPVPGAIDHEPVQPAGEGGLETIGLQPTGELQAGLLGDVLGVGAIAAPLVGEAVQGVVMRLEQCLECIRVTRLGLPY